MVLKGEGISNKTRVFQQEKFVANHRDTTAEL